MENSPATVMLTETSLSILLSSTLLRTGERGTQRQAGSWFSAFGSEACRWSCSEDWGTGRPCQQAQAGWRGRFPDGPLSAILREPSQHDHRGWAVWTWSFPRFSLLLDQ